MMFGAIGVRVALISSQGGAPVLEPVLDSVVEVSGSVVEVSLTIPVVELPDSSLVVVGAVAIVASDIVPLVSESLAVEVEVGSGSVGMLTVGSIPEGLFVDVEPWVSVSPPPLLVHAACRKDIVRIKEPDAIRIAITP
jgi:hypothetical protein